MKRIRRASSGAYMRDGIIVPTFATVAALRASLSRAPLPIAQVLGQDFAGDGFDGLWAPLEPDDWDDPDDGFTTVRGGARIMGRISGAFLVGPIAPGDEPVSWRSSKRAGVLTVEGDTEWGEPPAVADYGVKILANYTNETGTTSFSLRSWNGGDAIHVHGNVESPTATSGSDGFANLFLTQETMRFYLNNRQADSGPRLYRVNLFL